jgi:hypothetical protein
MKADAWGCSRPTLCAPRFTTLNEETRIDTAMLSGGTGTLEFQQLQKGSSKQNHIPASKTTPNWNCGLPTERTFQQLKSRLSN